MYILTRNERFLLRDLKFLPNTDLKIILLAHQNNFVGILKMSDVAKNFDILTINE